MTAQGPAAAVPTASVKQTVYKANAHEANVVDTTNVPTGHDSDGGPTWANDNLERKLTATQNTDGSWAVRIESQGSFSAYANPLDGSAWTGNGSVNGYVNYTVPSGYVPDGSRLPTQLPNTLHSADIVAKWFNAPASDVHGASVDGINYYFDYNPIPVPASVSFPSDPKNIAYGVGPNGLHYTQVG